MSGLQRILKAYGRMKCGNVMWAWDYANDKPVVESEMTKEQKTASERARWMPLRTPQGDAIKPDPNNNNPSTF